MSPGIVRAKMRPLVVRVGLVAAGVANWGQMDHLKSNKTPWLPGGEQEVAERGSVFGLVYT
jgi:hypothetical protein